MITCKTAETFIDHMPSDYVYMHVDESTAKCKPDSLFTARVQEWARERGVLASRPVVAKAIRLISGAKR